MSFFERLYTYRQKESKNDRENFLTELLAGVLSANPGFQQAFVNWAGLSTESTDCLNVQTQVYYPEGIPDLVISAKGNKLLLLVECKLEAEEGTDQLKNYEAIQKRYNAAQSAVVFLTKYYEPPRTGTVRHLRWHQLYALSNQAQEGELIKGFRQYLEHHNLHQPMSFTPTDLLVLENIAATTRKMDEVLGALGPLFQKVTGSYNQKNKSRSGKLHSGWYGLSSKFSGITLEVGFWSYEGGTAMCFYIVETDKAVGKVGAFQAALRKSWGLSEAVDLAYIELTAPVMRFMTGEGEGSDVAAMRVWFEDRMQELAQALVQNPL